MLAWNPFVFIGRKPVIRPLPFEGSSPMGRERARQADA
jgi:hypothetical protein